MRPNAEELLAPWTEEEERRLVRKVTQPDASMT